jgi:translocation and assembly module TamB
MKLFWRLTIGLAIFLLVAGLGLFIAARVYLSSHAVAGQVSTRLQAMLGAPVQVDTADVGMTGDSSLHGLRVFEAGEDVKPEPFITVGHVSADVSAWDLLAGKTPKTVTLTGAAIALHFDAAGRLLTHLPKPQTGGGPMPRVLIANGKLTLSQDGREPMVIQGIKAELVGAGADLKATGTIVDPFWGDWTLSGDLTNESGAVDLTLTAKNVAVDKVRLTGLPFIAPAVWREVLVEGKTPCDFNVHFELKDNPTMHYRVALAPGDATVHIESIHLDADHAAGKVVVDDNLVQLRGVHGRFAQGRIETEGDLDFRKAAWALKFTTVAVKKVVLHELPRDWLAAVRRQIDGELTGAAKNIEVTLADGRVRVTGTGEGVIENALVAGYKSKDPIPLKLRELNGKLQISSATPPSRLLAGFAVTTFSAPPAPASAPTAPSPPPLFQPVRLVEWLPNATAWATGRGAEALGKGLAIAGGWLSHKKGVAQAPEYLEFKLSLEDVDLGELLRRLDVKLPFPLEGKLTFQVQAAIPVNTPQELKVYRLNGTATLPRVNIAGVEMADVHTRLRFEKGILELQELKGRTSPPKGAPGAAGTFEGTARMEVDPLGDLSTDVHVDHFPLAVVLNLLPGAAGKADGSLTGHVQGRAPAKALTDPTTWRATGTLASERLQSYGLVLTDASADVSVAKGTAKVAALKATLGKAPLTGSTELTLSAPWNYTTKLTLKGVNLTAVQRLNPDFRPPFPVEGGADATADMHGTLRPFSVAASGTVNSSDLALDQFKVQSLSFKWDMDNDRVKLTDVKAGLYDGVISGTAVVPIRAAATGDVDLRLENVDVRGLAKSLPAVPVRLQGRATGTVKVTLPPAGPNGERPATGKIDLTAKALRVQNIPTDNLHADVDYKAGAAEYHLTGDSLGGRFTLDGKIPFRDEKKTPAPAAPKEPPEASSGRFHFEKIRLSRLWDALGLGASLGRAQGRADIDLPFRLVGAERTLEGNGRLNVRNLRLGDTLLTDGLTADLVLRNDSVQVRNLSAAVGEGGFRGVVVYNYRNPDRSYFNLQLEQVDVAVLLAAFPGAADAVEGLVDLHLRGNLGREWRGSGEAALTRGRVFGVEVDEWRLPVNFTFIPVRGRGQLTVRDSNAQLARGRATLQTELLFSTDAAPRLEGNARFYNAQLKSLVRPTSGLGFFAVGQVTGRVNFSADSLRSADDLNATIDATLNQTQALELPVLSGLVPFVAPGRSATTFQQGELRGRLARGVFRIQKFNLSSPVVRLAIVGTITTQGRLDLEATGSTGRIGTNPAFLRLIGLRIPVAGPIPIGLLLEASSYLSSRVIHLRVTGTVRNPDVHLEPVQILAEEVVRFFLLQSNVPLP